MPLSMKMAKPFLEPKSVTSSAVRKILILIYPIPCLSICCSCSLRRFPWTSLFHVFLQPLQHKFQECRIPCKREAPRPYDFGLRGLIWKEGLNKANLAHLPERHPDEVSRPIC